MRARLRRRTAPSTFAVTAAVVIVPAGVVRTPAMAAVTAAVIVVVIVPAGVVRTPAVPARVVAPGGVPGISPVPA